jgi:hypothetical protein
LQALPDTPEEQAARQALVVLGTVQRWLASPRTTIEARTAFASVLVPQLVPQLARWMGGQLCEPVIELANTLAAASESHELKLEMARGTGLIEGD